MTNREVVETLRAGMVCHQSDDLDAAEAHYRRVILLAPGQPDALNYLGLIVQQRGESEEAIGLLKRAVTARPGAPAFWNNLGSVLTESQRHREGIQAFREVLRLMPSHVHANYNLGLALLEVGDVMLAVSAFRLTVGLEPDDAEFWNSLGEALSRAQHLEEALEAFHTARRLDPEFAEPFNNIGLALLDQGDARSAAEHFREALRLSPGMPAALSNLTRTRRFERADRAVLDEMMMALENSALNERELAQLHFAIGKVHDDSAEYELAFEHYRAGNEVKARLSCFDEQRHVDLVRRTMAVFDAETIARLSKLGSTTDKPVFIVGMPRSGSTLVEQILASHPKMETAGELPNMTVLCHGMSAVLDVDDDYPECAIALNSSLSARFANDYLSALGGEANTVRVVDKMLTNFLYLGVINLLFPRAKVIYCRRDPRDVCLSNYFQLFEAGQFYSYRLDTLASYYRSCLRLMAHWKTVSTYSIHEVTYEDLVQRQEAVSRELIDFCGLPWNEACLEFHRSKRSVHTASNWQVRQKIYRRSVGRWKHYAGYLPESILDLP